MGALLRLDLKAEIGNGYGMQVIDADGHVNECPATFDDKYLDPAFRSRRPAIVGSGGLFYWMIGEQVVPRRSGLGCNNFSTPARVDGKPTRHGALIQGKNLDSLDSQELTDLNARLEALDAEDIDVQVIYPTLFLAYPLTTDLPLMTALCSSYNRWMGDTLSGSDRLKWAGVVNLEDVTGAVQTVYEAKSLGASAMMVLGTAGNHMLDDPMFLPFYEAMAETDLTLGVHVGWSCPSLNNLYSELYPSWITAFTMPLLMGFVAFMTGGILDRFPNLRVVFLEAGCLWIPFVMDRLNHRYPHAHRLANLYPQINVNAAAEPNEYLKRGNLYWSAEVEDDMLPQVMDLVGEGQIVFGSDIPHSDRERFAAKTLLERDDVSESGKSAILEGNPARLYAL